jgi:hypothetical protein
MADDNTGLSWESVHNISSSWVGRDDFLCPFVLSHVSDLMHQILCIGGRKHEPYKGI